MEKLHRAEGFPSPEDWEELQVEWDQDAGRPFGSRYLAAEAQEPQTPHQPDWDVLLED